VVISDREDSFALERASKAGFETLFIDPAGMDRDTFDLKLLDALENKAIDLVVLVGYMRIIGQKTLDRFRNRIINVHPSLLPAFCGKAFYDHNVHAAAIERGVKVTGCTIHFVNEECDGGPIILQKTIEVSYNDTPDTLKEKVQALEKKWYPEVIRWIAEGRVKVEGKKVIVSS